MSAFKNSIRRQKIRQIQVDLRKEGISPEDIRLAFQLASCIGTLDSLVFAQPVKILFRAWPSGDGTVACYNPKEKFYAIFARGLQIRIKEEWREQLLFLTRNKVVSYPVSRANKKKLVSWKEALVSVASHEIRHRMQYSPGFKMFTDKNPWLKRTTWGLYQKLSKAKKIRMKDVVELELSAHRDERSGAKNKIDLRELDALVVEGVAINLCHIGSSLAKIATIIKIQPRMAAAER